MRRQNCVGKSLFRVDIKRILLPHLKICILFIMLDPVSTGNDFRFPHKTEIISLKEMGLGSMSPTRKKSYSIVNMQELRFEFDD